MHYHGDGQHDRPAPGDFQRLLGEEDALVVIRNDGSRSEALRLNASLTHEQLEIAEAPAGGRGLQLREGRPGTPADRGER